MEIILHPVVLIIFVFVLFFGYLTKTARSPKMVHGNFINSYQFPVSLEQKLIEQYSHLSEQQAQEIIEGLRTYFQICNLAQDESKEVAMPSRAVDSAWHEFILHTKLYAEFCEQAFGRFMHHSPAQGMLTQTDAQLAMKHTFKQACIMFSISYKTPAKLPPIFALDRRLKIPQGFVYSLHCLNKNNGDYCLSHIDCTANFNHDGERST